MHQGRHIASGLLVHVMPSLFLSSSMYLCMSYVCLGGCFAVTGSITLEIASLDVIHVLVLSSLSDIGRPSMSDF
jgi:hypothetical protein